MPSLDFSRQIRSMFLIFFYFYEVSQTKSEQKTKKFKLDHQKKISVTLSKLEKCGLRAPVLSHMSCPLSIDWKKHSEYINPSRGMHNNPDFEA